MAEERTTKAKPARVCEGCGPYVRREIVGADVFTRENIPPWLQNTREVENFPNLTRHTDARHVVVAEKLLAKYDFRGNGWRVECSFPGSHRHARGYIVETVCGLILSIGHKCADDWVEGLKDAAKLAAAAQRYFASIEAMKRMARELPEIGPPAREVNELLEFRRAFRETLAHVAKGLREENDLHAFAGLALWRDSSNGIADLGVRFDELQARLETLPRTAPAPTVQKLQDAFSALFADAQIARRWFEAASAFPTHENLARVIAHYGVPASVTGGVITMSTRGSDRPIRLGLGVYELAPKGSARR